MVGLFLSRMLQFATGWELKFVQPLILAPAHLCPHWT